MQVESRELMVGYGGDLEVGVDLDGEAIRWVDKL
jgi:hypothetical protein